MRSEKRSFIELLVELLILITVFPRLIVLAPVLIVPLSLIWGFSFTLDAGITHHLYKSSPKKFFKMELNRIFSRMVAKFGFRRAIILYTLTVEVPAVFVFSLVLLFINADLVSGNIAVIVSLGTAMAIISFAHLTAWIHNRRVLRHFHIPNP